MTFVPHLVPLDRGILETIYVSLKPGTDEAQVATALSEAYSSAAPVSRTKAASRYASSSAWATWASVVPRVSET